MPLHHSIQFVHRSGLKPALQRQIRTLSMAAGAARGVKSAKTPGRPVLRVKNYLPAELVAGALVGGTVAGTLVEMVAAGGGLASAGRPSWVRKTARMA